MSAIQAAVASNDALKVIDSVHRLHFCILEKTGNPLVVQNCSWQFWRTILISKEWLRDGML